MEIQETTRFTRTVNGQEITYKRTEKGYCFANGKRIKAAEFDQAWEAMIAERREAAQGRREEVAKEAAKKAKRTRKPKDVAGTYETSEGIVTLTAKQLDFLHEVNNTSEDELLGDPVNGFWCDVLTDVIGGQFAGKPMTVGAMLSTICEKGLGERSKERRNTSGSNSRKVTTFVLTQKGREVWDQVTAE